MKKKYTIKMLSILLTIGLSIGLSIEFCSCNAQKEKQKFTKTYLNYFDTASTIIGYSDSEEEFEEVAAFVAEELSSYHELYDIYYSYEGVTNLYDINKLYDGEHKTHKVDTRIMELLIYAKEMYNLTRGETNIAMGGVLSIWHDYREHGKTDPENSALPKASDLEDAFSHSNIENLILDDENSTVFISDPYMTLDVGAIAKGYAVEMIAKKLEEKGISGYTLNVGGNIRVIGAKPDGSPWTIAIENPNTDDDDPYIEYLNITDGSVVTSGSYQRYYYVDGKAYHHIIDKDTLYPSEYFASVSVVCRDSGLADALSTALFSMSYEDGLSLVDNIPEAEALWCMTDGKILYSSGLEQYIKK